MIHIKKSVDDQFYFIVKSTNGKTLLTSETYTRRSRCREGIVSALTNMRSLYKGDSIQNVLKNKVKDHTLK